MSATTRKAPTMVAKKPAPAPAVVPGAPKFCVDCRFYERGMTHPGFCMHHADYNLVTGDSSLLLCRFERSVGSCGEAGKNFEAKQ